MNHPSHVTTIKRLLRDLLVSLVHLGNARKEMVSVWLLFLSLREHWISWKTVKFKSKMHFLSVIISIINRSSRLHLPIFLRAQLHRLQPGRASEIGQSWKLTNLVHTTRVPFLQDASSALKSAHSPWSPPTKVEGESSLGLFIGIAYVHSLPEHPGGGRYCPSRQCPDDGVPSVGKRCILRVL